MPEGREDVLKSLGVKRRSREPQAEGDPPRPKAKSSSGPKLGIKRRRRPGAEDSDESALVASAFPAGEIPDGEAAEGEPAEGEGAEAAPAEPKSVLGNDDTAVMLATFFKVRPTLREQIPPRAFQLKRTNGRYIGDGRPERTLKVGFKPSLVVYTVPPYPDGNFPKVEREGGLIDPPLHAQPTFVDEGFVVSEELNILGDWYVYVVFEDDGEPLEAAEPDAKKKRRGRGQQGAGEVAKGLGIRRRK